VGDEHVTEKIDLKRSLDSYQAKKGVFRILDVPPMGYLMIDGHGDPNAPEFGPAVEALYPVAYALKFASKKAGRDYVVPPLEGLWWADDMDSFTTSRNKSTWRWTLMLLVPDWISAEQVAEHNTSLRFEVLHEGTCVQTMHLGSFDDEGPVLAELHNEFIPGNGLRMTGKHHEIYLSDPRKSAPEKLRTILRQPVAHLVRP
jgi:hypothetical protein